MNKKNSAKNFLSLFKKHKIQLITVIIFIIVSSILSIIVPLKTGKIIDTVLENITIKNNNNKANEEIEKYKPLIKDLETINYEAIYDILKNPTVKDLVKAGLIKEKSLNIINTNIKNKILNTNIFEFKNINCYECMNNKDYIKTINNIYEALDINTNITIKNTIETKIIKDLVTTVTCIIIIFLINYLANKKMSKISKEITLDLRSKINKKLFKISLQNYSKNKEGDILSIVSNDIDNISTTISTEIVGIINSLILIISLIIIMFILSVKLTFIIIALIPVILILLIITIIKSSKYYKENQDTLGDYNDFILNSYKGYKTIRSYNQKDRFINKEEKINKKLYSNTWKSNFYSGLMQPIVTFAGNLNFLIVCIFGSMLVIEGKLSIGNLQAFLTYAKNFNSPLIGIASTIGIIEQTLASHKRINDFLSIDEEKEKNVYEQYNFNQDIVFENISFSYTNKKVLNNLSFTLKKGEKIAIVGETGSGKTTLIKLLLGLYKPNEGQIKIGEKNINSINKRLLRDNINIVLQDSWLFEGTIKENINYGTEKNDQLVKNVCKRINLDKIILKLPNKYNYLINENSNLSKGEKQLISIARAFMQNKDILILDEATSSIDIETEVIIRDSIDKLMINKTCLIIAHRLSTIINSDKIIVMQNGQIVEEGTHEELIRNKGYYYRLYRSQYE